MDTVITKQGNIVGKHPAVLPVYTLREESYQTLQLGAHLVDESVIMSTKRMTGRETQLLTPGQNAVAKLADCDVLDIFVCNEIASKRENLSGVLGRVALWVVQVVTADLQNKEIGPHSCRLRGAVADKRKSPHRLPPK